jgi:hypothetical protein
MYYTKVLVNPHKRKHFGKHEQSLVEILGRLNKKKHGQTSEVLDLLALLVLDLLALVLFFAQIPGFWNPMVNWCNWDFL